jgi:hypothetical protein
VLRLFECGGCQLEGFPFLFAVMEYADQTLAQLLQHRALTDDEAKEMLSPILDALQLLHGRNLVQGQVKPANILVVGDQLKLASDTIHRVSDGMMTSHTPTVYDPPEARHRNYSPAGDVWGLGVSLFEALTRRPPAALGELRDAPVLPPDFSPAFRDVIARCLSTRPQDRPGAAELAAWARGDATLPAPAPISQAAMLVATEVAAITVTEPEPIAPASMAAEPKALDPPAPEPVPPPPVPPQVASVGARPAAAAQRVPGERGLPPVVLGLLLILPLVWIGVRVFTSHHTPAPPPPALQASATPPSAATGSTPPAAGEVPVTQPRTAVPAAKPGRSEPVTPLPVIHEVIPDVPWSARRTIRGHINVWVRVIVDQDGTVLAAMPDRPGPSRYFEKVAVDAAKKWTFARVDTPSRRITQLRFDFSRDGTSGHAVVVH